MTILLDHVNANVGWNHTVFTLQLQICLECVANMLIQLKNLIYHARTTVDT